MSVTVGVDGGQSRIRLRVSGDPRVATAPGISHVEAHTANDVVETITGLWNGRGEQISRLVAGLTTVPGNAEERRLMAAHLADAMGAREVWLGGDHVTSHAGALAGATGVILSAGTGVACLAIAAGTGAHASFDGAGYLVGDEGGGFWLGRHGIRAALSAYEGRGPRTSLTEVLAARFGALPGVAARLHSNPRAVDTIARMAVVVLAEAASGDQVAAAIVSDATDRLVTTASAGVRFLSPAPEMRVALGGRLLLENHQLADAVSSGIRANHPEVPVVMASGSSLDGACQLAESAHPGPYRALLTMYGPEP